MSPFRASALSGGSHAGDPAAGRMRRRCFIARRENCWRESDHAKLRGPSFGVAELYRLGCKDRPLMVERSASDRYRAQAGERRSSSWCRMAQRRRAELTALAAGADAADRRCRRGWPCCGWHSRCDGVGGKQPAWALIVSVRLLRRWRHVKRGWRSATGALSSISSGVIASWRRRIRRSPGSSRRSPSPRRGRGPGAFAQRGL